MASIAELIKGLKKLDDQSFRPGDSLIASTVNHPLDALSQLGKWLTKSVNTAAGIPDQYDNPYPLLAPSPEAQSQAAFDVAGMAQLGGMPFAPKSAGGTVGTFIGPKAATWDANKAAAASKLLDEGVDPAQVWREHLIGRMPDGKLFSEISDSGVNFAVRPVDEKYNRMPIGRAINHPDAFNAYPENWETKIQFTDGGEGSFGNDLVKVGVDDAPYPISTTLHELQHAIQQREGWARGGSPEQFKNEYEMNKSIADYHLKKFHELKNSIKQMPEYQTLSSARDEAMAIDDKNAVANYSNKISELINDTGANNHYDIWKRTESQIIEPYEAYRRLTGEAQARATQDRLNMSMDERRNNYPLAGGKLSDIPLEQLIYRYGDNGPAMSSSDNLNVSLLQKYLQQGSLTPDELAQYERNAIAMRDSNRQYLNVANADAQGGTAMDRAGAMGFDTKTYHGEVNRKNRLKDVTESGGQAEQGRLFMTDTPALASQYTSGLNGGAVYPLTVRSSDLYHAGFPMPDNETINKMTSSEIDSLLKNIEKYNDSIDKSRVVNSGIYEADAAGKPIVKFHQIKDTPGYDPLHEWPVDVYAAKGGVRSRFAAFDPLRKDSADLLATKLLPATMLGWGMYNEKKKRSLADLLGAQ